ncbi:hypothetical protein F4561_005059 [Lipingzhangella halophila]|uniref:Uncharacterized protein n=1 Tax=Lipingzhangella halophila TaxID=1783352 RepID=A0A7W7RLN1_9ACTN|nr:hypothetical protein [Lipingzhangella halophila]
MNKRIYLWAWTSALGAAAIIALLATPSTGFKPQSSDERKVVCASALSAGFPRGGGSERWDEDNGIIGDHAAVNNACDARRTERLSWALLIAVPTSVIATVTILRWPRKPTDAPDPEKHEE